MTKIKWMAALACAGVLITGCTSPNGGIVAGLGGVDSSWEFIDPVVTQSGPTITVSAKRWTHIGKSGFQFAPTNSVQVFQQAAPTSAPTAELAQPAPRTTPSRTPLPRTGPPYATPKR